MIKKIIIFGIFLFAVSPSFAQSKKQSVRELISVMKLDSLMSKVLDSMMPSFGLNESVDKESMKPVMKALNKIMQKFVEDDMVDLYDKYFTAFEINDFIAFYKSPTGQKSLITLPAIQKETMEIMMSKYMPEMMKSIEDSKK
jgi:uncharacterized protein